MLPVIPISPPGVALSARTSSSSRPDRTVVFCHPGSFVVLDTTYFGTSLRCLVKPVVSSVWRGQNDRNSSKVRRPRSKAGLLSRMAPDDVEQLLIVLLSGVEPGVEELDHAVRADVLRDDQLAVIGHSARPPGRCALRASSR